MLVDGCSLKVMLDLHKMHTETDFRPELRKISVPTLLVWRQRHFDATREDSPRDSAAHNRLSVEGLRGCGTRIAVHARRPVECRPPDGREGLTASCHVRMTVDQVRAKGSSLRPAHHSV